VPRRDLRKSKAEGLYKRCRHLSWDKCSCPWWGRAKRSRVSLGKWAGVVIPNKEAAKVVLSRLEAAVLAGSFDPRGETPHALGGDMTFSTFLDEFTKRHVDEDGLRSNSVASYLKVFRQRFGTEKLSSLAANPYVFEKWLKDEQQRLKWENSTFNRYFEHGRAMFNWAKGRKLASENPFDAFERKQELNKRDVRIAPEQEQKLLEACETLDTPRPSKLTKLTLEMVEDIRRRVEAGEQQKDVAAAFGVSRPLVCQIINGRVRHGHRGVLGREMKRRLFAALDLGLREGEMLLLQVKHIDFDNWIIRLPSTITKAAVDQQVFAGTQRLQDVLTERRGLGAEKFVFGREDGRYVASFDRTWRTLFKRAGLKVGRKQGLVWHDLRHEYGSFLIEQGATIQEAKEMMRHADIRTTARYLTADPRRLRELAGKMGLRVG
jgi:site-specific recombinase XerD